AGTSGATSAPDAASGDITVADGTLDVASARLASDRDLRVGFDICKPGGDCSRIELLSGQSERGALRVGGTLRADEIVLQAGVAGRSGSLISFDSGARLLRSGAADLAPRLFSFAQEDSLSALPDVFALMPALGRDGMRYALASLSGDVTLA